MKRYAYLLLAATALLGSCSGNKFKVSGTIEGAGDSTSLYLESANNGTWVTVDSTTASGKGAFSFSEPAPDYPNIYRIRLGDKAVYFPIDSTDVLTLTSKAKDFDRDFTVSGSEAAQQVMKIDKDAVHMLGANPQQLQAWKDQLARQILKDPSGIVAYYVICKYMNDRPLFDPLNDKDMKIIGAVANAFNSFKPGDPRTQYLVQMTLQAQQRRRLASGQGAKVQAEQISLIDIKLQDAAGKTQSLQQVANSHSLVLLSFTMYDQQFSPAYNRVLNDIYTKYKAQGMTIYQVGLDQNMGEWRTAAGNLPWITVYDPSGEYSKNVSAYNLTSLPTTFVIKNGDIVERVEDMLQLPAKVAAHQ